MRLESVCGVGPLASEIQAAETDCVAGVVGLELRNPLGSKSAGVAGGISAALAEIVQQRRFALELRRGERAAAVGFRLGIVGQKAEQV